MSKSWNDLIENDLTDLDSFNSYVTQIHDKLGELQAEIKGLEDDIHTNKMVLKNLQTRNKYNAVYKNYLSAKDRDNFFWNHETEMIIYEAAETYLSSRYKRSNLPTEDTLTKNIKILTRKSNTLYQSHKAQKEKVKDVNQLRQNLDDYLRQEDSRAYTKEQR